MELRTSCTERLSGERVARFSSPYKDEGIKELDAESGDGGATNDEVVTNWRGEGREKAFFNNFTTTNVIFHKMLMVSEEVFVKPTTPEDKCPL